MSKIDLDGKIEEIMKPAQSAMNVIEYGEAVTIGTSFGQLITIIQEQEQEINRLNRECSQWKEKWDKISHSNEEKNGK